MERGVAAAGEGFPHQLRSIVHQGATARASSIIFEAMACLTPSTLWPHWDRALVQDRRWSIRSTRMSLVLGMLRGLPLQWAYLTQLLPVSSAL